MKLLEDGKLIGKLVDALELGIAMSLNEDALFATFAVDFWLFHFAEEIKC